MSTQNILCRFIFMKKTVLAIFIHTLRKQALLSDCWQNWRVESAYLVRM